MADPVPDRIFHLAERDAWAAARASGEYRRSTLGRSLEEVGFIHCSTAEQWPVTRSRFYADHPGELVLLTIDPARVPANVVMEVGNPSTGEEFPHIYGPLPTAAVVDTELLPLPHGWPNLPPHS